MKISLAVIEEIVSASGIAGTIEQLLPAGVRERQLTAGTLLTGMRCSPWPADGPRT